MPTVTPAPRASPGCSKDNFFAGRFPGVVQGRAEGVIPSPSAKPLFPRRRRILTGGEPVFSDGLFGLRLDAQAGPSARARGGSAPANASPGATEQPAMPGGPHADRLQKQLS